MYEIDEDSKLVVDWVQYRLDMATANNKLDDLELFDEVYRFTDYYQWTDLSPSGLDNWIQHLNNTESEMVKYLNNKYTGGPGSPTSCDAACRNSNACDMRHGVFSDVLECKGESISNTEKLLELLYGGWTIKTD